MKAAVLYEPMIRMPIVDLVQQSPKPGEVRVRMEAAGVCASDHHVINGTAIFPKPIVLGHEGAGTVAKLGDGVTSVSPGQRCILCFVPDCGRCRSCRAGLPNLCDTNRKTGTRQYDGTLRLHDKEGRGVHQYAKLGVFGESVVIPQQACFPIPDELPAEVAALIGCSVTTGVGAVINQPGMKAGMSVAVFGAGGVGLNAIQGARLLNASRIIAVDIHNHKLEFTYKFGATDVINAREQDAVKAIQDLTGGGVDYAFDSFGSKVTTRQMVDSTRKGGVAVLIGLAPDGDRAGIDMVDMVRNQKTLTGSYYGSVSPHQTFRTLVDFYLNGKIDVDSLIVRRYELDEINEGFDALARGEDGRGVIVYEN